MASDSAAQVAGGFGGGGGGDIGQMVMFKVAVFILVQILVYLILRKSSNVFSKSPTLKSFSFKIARASSTVARVFGAVSESPFAGGDEYAAAAAEGWSYELKEN